VHAQAARAKGGACNHSHPDSGAVAARVAAARACADARRHTATGLPLRSSRQKQVCSWQCHTQAAVQCRTQRRAAARVSAARHTTVHCTVATRRMAATACCLRVWRPQTAVALESTHRSI
jgi:hypothetical protein